MLTFLFAVVIGILVGWNVPQPDFIKVIKDNWDLFEAMGKHAVTAKMEDETINQLFRTRGYYLFVPIPSLALHMQYDTELDDQIDWRVWWDRFAKQTDSV